MTEQSEVMSPLEKLRYRLSSMATSGEVILDVVEAVRGRRFWIELAINDIRGRYRPWRLSGRSSSRCNYANFSPILSLASSYG